MDMLPKPADAIIAGVGPRLRALRKQHGQTLEKLAAATGISVSTLSRPESARRRPTLDLLLPLAQAHDVPLDILIGAPPVGDPRIYPRPVVSDEVTLVPLSRNTSGLNAVKQVFSPSSASGPHVPQRVHDGYIWLYVITGTLRLTSARTACCSAKGMWPSSTPAPRTRLRQSGSGAPRTADHFRVRPRAHPDAYRTP